jgi:Zn finger protein HypA/HybF involved in hydrogenase expression
MRVTFDCPLCDTAITLEEDIPGQEFDCPECGGRIIQPGPGATIERDSIDPAIATSPIAPATVGPVPPEAIAEAQVQPDDGADANADGNTHNAASPTDDAIQFTFTCRRCGSALQGNSHISNQHGRCPTCAAVFIVPDVDHRTGLPTGPAIIADDGELPTPVHAYAAAGAKAPRIRRISDDEHAIVCPQCDFQTEIEANICPRCGLPFTIEGADQVRSGGGYSVSALSQASLTLGVLSIATFCIPVPLLGAAAVALGLTALSRASAREERSSRAAIAGVMLGIGGCAVTIAWMVM